jgi:hypothetical protein
MVPCFFFDLTLVKTDTCTTQDSAQFLNRSQSFLQVGFASLHGSLIKIPLYHLYPDNLRVDGTHTAA